MDRQDDKEPTAAKTPAAKVVDFAARRREIGTRGDAEVRHQLRRILKGDRAAAAWLYDSFAPGLHRRLSRRYGYPGGLDADDLLQDAFVFYFQRGAKVLGDFMERVPPEEQTPERLERHLWDLACGVASNRRRSAALRDHVSLDDSPPEAMLEGDSGERELIDRDQLRRIDHCLRERGTRLYLYYKLRYWDGYSPHEIAEITGWSRKATYKLRQALNEAVRSCAEELGIRPRGDD